MTAQKLPGQLHPEHSEAHADLMQTIEAAIFGIPCLAEDWKLWTSEEHDQQRAAASACHGCPVIRQCRNYGDQFEISGTWGGHTLHRITPKRRPKRAL